MKQLTLLILVVLIAMCGFPLAQSQTANSTSQKSSVVPNLVNFSGTVKDLNGKAMSGVVGITFALYSNEQGGAPLWLETQNVSADKGGHYSVSLGATKVQGIPAELFVAGEAQWLGVQIEGQSEQPRVLLLSVPYALKAADAETIGGLPPSAFMLVAPTGGASATPAGAFSSATANSLAPPPASVTGSGTVNFVPLWTSTSAIGSSVLFQSGTGSAAKVGINTSSPGATLDVKGNANIQGALTAPATGTATSTAGKASQPQDFVASSFSSSTRAAVNQTFQWKAEAANNNTATASGTLNLLFGSGTAAPTETGLKLSSKGLFTFATGQTFPGVGTITGVTTATGSGLTGGGTTGTLALSLLKTCSTNQTLQWSGTTWACATLGGSGTITGVTAGTDLTGGGTSGNVTLNLNTAALQTSNDARYAQLGANNTFSKTMTFAAGQTFPGAGTVTSVGLAAPSSDFTVSSSPITTTGTLNLGWTVAPTSANTVNAIVKRDSLGNFSTNTVTASSVVSSGVTATTVTADTLNVTNFNPSGTISVSTGNTNALVGSSSATNATTIYGRATATSGAGWGVAGLVDSSDGSAKGTYGVALASSGTGEGVNGVSLSPFGLGVVGQGGGNIFSSTGGSNIGVWPIGVLGDTSLPNGIGVLGATDNGYGIVGLNNDSFYNAALFYNASDANVMAAVGSINGVYIDGAGNLFADGTITGSVKNFRIDHPLDPANKFLNHASIESSEMLNLYTGNAVLDGDGSSVVTLPEWFTALNGDFRYQLTPIGGFARLYIAEEVSGNQFRIAGGHAGMKVSWQITGVRQDAYAKTHPLVVEAAKQGDERGHYLHPDAFGQPKELSITAAKNVKMLPKHSGKTVLGTPKDPRGF